MARLLLIDKHSLFHEVVDCNDLADYYKYLDCRVFDITRRKVGEKIFDIFVDDEGLLKDNPIPTAFTSDFEVALVGNLLFANHDAEGNTTSLSDEDIECIINNLYFVTTNEDFSKTHVCCVLNTKGGA